MSLNLKKGLMLLACLVLVACSSEEGSGAKEVSSVSATDSESSLVPWTTIARKTVGIGQSNAKAVIFYDPMCPHCAHLKDNISSATEPLNIKWVPVAILSPASLEIGSRILASNDPAAEFDAHERNVADNVVPSVPAVQDESKIKGAEDAVKANTAIFTKLELTSIPAIVTVDKNNNLVIETGSKSLPEFMSIYRKFQQ